MRTAFLLSTAIFFSLGLSVCDDKKYDFYTEVFHVCNFTIRPDFAETDQTTTLTKECADALEAILPFDDSWANDTSGYKLRVLEAYQFIIGRPLRLPPEWRVFGVSPNAFPASLVRIATSDSNPNKALFNYAVNNVKQITLAPLDVVESGSAKMFGDGHLTILPHFWNSVGGSITPSTNLSRASTMLHEARHADGIYHVDCPFNDPGLDPPTEEEVDYFECDPDMSGPHGLSVLFYEMLIQGRSLERSDAVNAAQEICDNLTTYTKNYPKDLKKLLAGLDSCYAIDYDWLLLHEQL